MKYIYTLLCFSFLVSCQKGHEGFPNYLETDKFDSKFVIYNNGDDSLSNVVVFSELYFPFENTYSGLSIDSSAKKWQKYDSLVFQYDEKIYIGCKANLDIQLSYYYSAADSIPKVKKTTTYVIPYQVLDKNKNGIKFNWPNDTVYFSVK